MVGSALARRSRVLAGTIILSSLVIAVHLGLETATTKMSLGYMKQLFGVQEVLRSVHPDRTSVIVVGVSTVPDPPIPGALFNDELVIGGALLKDGKWWARSLQEYLLPAGPACTTKVVPHLVPGGSIVLANCLNGGTDGQGFVAVAGRPRGYALPVVLLALTCGQTSATVKGKNLVVWTEGERPGSVYPGAKQPTFVFTWQGGMLSTPALDIYKYCTSPDDYGQLQVARRRP